MAKTIVEVKEDNKKESDKDLKKTAEKESLGTEKKPRKEKSIAERKKELLKKIKKISEKVEIPVSTIISLKSYGFLPSNLFPSERYSLILSPVNLDVFIFPFFQ